jgi:Zn-dependent membrane protease YugP
MGIYMGLMIIGGIFSFIGMFLSKRLKSVFKKYEQVGLRNGMSGAEIAAEMLKHYSIHDVRIVEGEGFLSDHYNPKSKTVSLSPAVFRGRNVSAAAVSAHECGHAVQHAEAYSMLKMRSALVPLVQISATAQQYLFTVAFLFAGGMGNEIILMIAIGVFGVTALFSVVTLPVEFDASNRALAWLNSSNTLTSSEHKGAKDALWWAAMTYVSAALAAVVQVLYLVMILMSKRSN